MRRVVNCLYQSLVWSALPVLLLAGASTIALSQDNNVVSYGVLFDNTRSMNQLLPLQREIGERVAERVNGGKLSVYEFATTPSNSYAGFDVVVECSTDTRSIQKKMGIGVVDGQTKLIDAIKDGVERLSKPVKPECDKSGERILVVMTDGEDRASESTVAQLEEAVNGSGVRLYIVGLLTNLPKSGLKKSRKFLTKLATSSKGRIVLPKEEESAQDIVTKLFAENYSFPK